MSCYWDLYCRTCNSKAGFENLNHKGDELALLWKDAERFAMAADIEHHLGEVMLEWELGHGLIYTRMPHGFFHWCNTHLHHDVVPRNEYRRFYDRCLADTVCECGSRMLCILKAGHNGPHQFEDHKGSDRDKWVGVEKSK